MGTFLNFIVQNFMHVAPILAAAAFAIVIILERFRALIWAYPLDAGEVFFEKIRNMAMADKIGDAIALCERYRTKPVVQVVKEGLMRADQPEALIEHGLQLAVGEATEKVQARTSFLATIANVATLLGLLGTIMGLVQSFEAVGAAQAQERSAMLAAGISTAMNATMLGLGVAIPCMIAFSFLMNRTNKLIAQIDRGAVRTMDILKQRYYSPNAELVATQTPSTPAAPPTTPVTPTPKNPMAAAA
jgi:biopolymer transport protein ExbB